MTVSESYVKQLVALQTRLYAYILTLLSDVTAAEDVLQETNLVLYCKAGEFVEGTNFDAWAFRTARNQCLAYWTLRNRDRIVLDDQAIYGSVDPVESSLSKLDIRREALNECLKKLSAQQRELVEARYAPGGSVAQLAQVWRRTESAISQSLYRIRNSLSRCIRQRLAGQ
jgi:RNA polymerase sigma-70 factor (ECF subfamily)